MKGKVIKRQLFVFISAIMLVFSACGGKVSEEKVVEEKASDEKAVEEKASEEQVSVQVGETTDQIFFTNKVTFTASTPFVYMGQNDAATVTSWQIKDMPYATFNAGILTDKDYEKIASDFSSTTRPEGIYGLGGPFGFGYTYFFVTRANGKPIYITGDPSLGNISVEDFDDNVAKIGEIYLQLVEDLVKSGNASASETSGVTIIKREGQQPVPSVYVHD